MNAAIRTCFGIQRRIRETMVLDMIRTKLVARPMASALITELVTARVGHMPSSITNTGFSRQIPRVTASSSGCGGVRLSVIVSPLFQYGQIFFQQRYGYSRAFGQHVGDCPRGDGGAADGVDFPGVGFL